MAPNNLLINDVKHIGASLQIIRKYLKILILELSNRVKQESYIIPPNYSLSSDDFYEMCLELLEKNELEYFVLNKNNEYKEVTIDKIKIIVESNKKTKGVLFDYSQFITYSVIDNFGGSND